MRRRQRVTVAVRMTAAAIAAATNALQPLAAGRAIAHRSVAMVVAPAIVPMRRYGGRRFSHKRRRRRRRPTGGAGGRGRHATHGRADRNRLQRVALVDAGRLLATLVEHLAHLAGAQRQAPVAAAAAAARRLDGGQAAQRGGGLAAGGPAADAVGQGRFLLVAFELLPLLVADLRKRRPPSSWREWHVVCGLLENVCACADRLVCEPVRMALRGMLCVAM